MPVQALVGCAARKNSVLRHGTNRLNARRGLLAPHCLAGGCVPPINLKKWQPRRSGQVGTQPAGHREQFSAQQKVRGEGC